MTGRRLLVAAGLAMFVIGLVETSMPGTFPLPGSEIALTLFGIVLLLYAAVVFRSRRRNSPDCIETPEVELAAPTSIPGTELEETLSGFPGAGGVHAGIVSSLREGLREAAVVVLARFEAEDADDARERIEAGTWTSDPYAAGFLSESGQPDRSFRDRLRHLFARDSLRRRTLRRSADAIAEKAGVEIEGQATNGTAGESEADVETGTAGRAGEIDTGESHVRHRQPTDHWTGVSVVAFLCLGFGLFFEEPGVLLAGIAGISYAAYARSSFVRPADLSVARSVSETEPHPDEEIEVTLTVTNEGGFCPDLRIVDGVPDALGVEDGSPRCGTALRAGESVTVSYTVTAKQGRHEFGPVLALTRDLSGSSEQEHLLQTESEIRTAPPTQPAREPVPLRKQHTQYAGQSTTDTGGEGIEFQTVREYQPGDSMTRIDWNRRARTGELTTLEFRRERAANVVILVDVRGEADVGHARDVETAVERSIEGANRLFLRLLADGHQVGVAAMGAPECYLRPGSGGDHRQRGQELMAIHPAFQHRSERGDSRVARWERSLMGKFPERTQLLVFSPLLNWRTARIVRRFEAAGFPTTVISADPTSASTPSRRLMRARRRLVLAEVRQSGIPVLDWPPGEPIEKPLKREVTIR